MKMSKKIIRPPKFLKRLFNDIHSAFQSLDLHLSPKLSIQRVRDHKWRKSDFQYLLYTLLSLPSFYLMSTPPFPFKLFIPLLYLLVISIPLTSQFFLPGTPILVWLLVFFSARFIPTDFRPTINVTILPTLESVWYGANISNLVTSHRHWVLDLAGWLPYGVVHYVVPFVIAAIAWVYAPIKGPPSRNGHKPLSALQFWGLAFGTMNIIGVIVQILFPCAPPCMWNFFLTLYLLIFLCRVRIIIWSIACRLFNSWLTCWASSN